MFGAKWRLRAQRKRCRNGRRRLSLQLALQRSIFPSLPMTVISTYLEPLRSVGE